MVRGGGWRRGTYGSPPARLLVAVAVAGGGLAHEVLVGPVAAQAAVAAGAAVGDRLWRTHRRPGSGARGRAGLPPLARGTGGLGAALGAPGEDEGHLVGAQGQRHQILSPTRSTRGPGPRFARRPHEEGLHSASPLLTERPVSVPAGVSETGPEASWFPPVCRPGCWRPLSHRDTVATLIFREHRVPRDGGRRSRNPPGASAASWIE